MSAGSVSGTSWKGSVPRAKWYRGSSDASGPLQPTGKRGLMYLDCQIFNTFFVRRMMHNV